MKRALTLTFALTLFSAAALAQNQNNFNGGGNGVGVYTVATLPAAPANGTVAVVTDASTATTCATGGGANYVFCRFVTGTGWGTFSGGSAAAGGATTQVQYNNAGALAGIAQWTTNGTTTITGGATSVLNISAASLTVGFQIPTGVGAAPTADGFISFDTTTHLPKFGSNGTTITIPTTLANVSHKWLNSYTQTTGAFTQTQPASADLSDVANLVFNNAANTYSGTGLQDMNTVDLRLPNHASDPATCAVGQIEFNTVGVATKICTATNTWTALGAGGGTTTNALTLNNSNSGAASGSTFNGSAAVTLSSNTLGAPNLAAANTYSGGGLQDFNAMDLLQPVHSADPATCSPGQIEFNSVGAAMKVCTATNTWTALGAGGGTVTHTVGALGANILEVGNSSGDTETLDQQTNKYFDVPTSLAPANPGAGFQRYWSSSSTGALSCLTSAGANCMPSGTISGLTAGVIPQATSPTAIGNSSPVLDNGNTTASTLSYAGTGGIAATAGPVSSAGPTGKAGMIDLVGNIANQTIPVNQFAWGGFSVTNATAYGLQPPNAAPSGGQSLSFPTPTSGWSQASWITPLTAPVALTSLATQAANTVTANVTAGSAAPTAAAIPSGIQNYVAGTGYNQATSHQIGAALNCADTSASGTAQVCNTSPSFTPAANDCIIYTTTTANTGTGLTLNVNSLGAKSVAKWQGTTTLAANDVLAGKQVLACYDGTNWELGTIGNAPGGSSAWSALTNAGASLSLTNSGFNTTFTQNAADEFLWQNTTASTVTTPQNSPLLGLAGTAWVGAGASGPDGWTFQDVVTAGLNGNSTLTLGHTGTSTGHLSLAFPGGGTLRTDGGIMAMTAVLGNQISLGSGSDQVFVGSNNANAITDTLGDPFSGTSLVVNFTTTAAGQKLVLTTQLKATAALTSGQVVKIDTANANSVVVAATTDTGAGAVLGFIENSPGAGAVGYVALPGSIITDPLVGTGTCTIGQFVIVDTTTAGRVKCTGTFTAGAVLGRALTTQNTVGSAVSVYVQPL